MSMIRVFIVDDSVIVRKMLHVLIEGAADFEVVGEARNGAEALQLIPAAAPDIIVLDVLMPVLGGIETLVELRKTDSTTPVIMFSSITRDGASATLEALSSGASDYVTKPHGAENTEDAINAIREELFPKIRALCPPGFRSPPSATAGRSTVQVARRPRHWSRPRVIAISASTGGPNALASVLTPLPENFPVPVLIVQHMPPLFTGFLAQRLDSLSNLQVVEAEEGMELASGRAIVAPGDFHMTVSRRGVKVAVELNREPPVNSCRPAADLLLASAARAFGSRLLSVVLTGMGKDGLDGSAAVRDAGGMTVVQDEESSGVWGMPGAVANGGLADKVLTLDEIPGELVRAVLKTVD